MPIAKYKKDKSSGLYYTYEKTGNYKPDGTPEYKKLRAKTIAALDQKVKDYREKAAFGVSDTNITVDQWFVRWIVAYKGKCRVQTQDWYKNLYTAHIRPNIGNIRLSDVKEHHLQKILSDMSDHYAKSTVRGIRLILRGLFETAQHNRLIVINPATHLTIAGRSPKQRRALTKDERKKYLSACTQNRFGTFAAFLYFFGLRRGEALALTGKDISRDHICICKQHIFPSNNQPVLENTKTDAGIRNIPIPDAARKYIDFDALPQGLLFTDDTGKALSYSEAVDRWNSFLSFALGDDTDITMHCLRHNYCTMLFEKKVDILTAKEYMGHEDIETTLKIYTHYTETLRLSGDKRVRRIG